MKIIALDGKEFRTVDACVQYESKLNEEFASKYKIPDAPLDMLVYGDYYDPDDSICNWYKADNENQLIKILEIKNVDNKAEKVKKFPHIFCIESIDGVDNWYYSLDEMIEKAKRFFKCFGYDMNLTKED